jgi:uncharacterized protein YcbK (DUF882 family)
MGDLSPNFSRWEFACKCGCGFDTVDVKLIEDLETIREHFDRRVDINSGCRCESHNRAVGGSKNSQHMLGRAADIVVDGVPPRIVGELAHQIGVGGLKAYETFTHIDSRNGVARW